MDGKEEPKPPNQKPPGGERKPEEETNKSFWATLPGILTAVTSLIVAIGGLIVVLTNAGLIQPRSTATPTPTFTSTPTQTFTPTPTPTITPSPTQTDTPAPTHTSTPTPTETFIPTPIETYTPTPTKGGPLTPTSTFTHSPTPTVAPTPTLVIVPQLQLCMRTMNDSAVVRQGPDINTTPLGNVPSEACLNFDVRLPDDTWVRIAQDKNDLYKGLAGGWIRAENMRELKEIDHLDFYKSKDALDGLYCVSSFTGINVRDCADKACPVIRSLRRGDCLIFNGRLADSAWLRIAPGQTDYLDLADKWAASVNLIVKEFFAFLDPHDMLPYFQLLPVATPPPTATPTPTPGG